MMRRLAITVACLMLVAGRAVPERQAIVAEALRYKRQHIPEALIDQHRAHISDEGKIWRVTFPGPDGSIGGGVIILVDKRTRRGVRFLGLQ